MRKWSISSFVLWAKRFFGGFIFVSKWKQSKLKKQTFYGTHGHHFFRRIFPLSNATTRRQCSFAGQQFSRCWPAAPGNIWFELIHVTLIWASESAHSSRKHTSHFKKMVAAHMEFAYFRPTGTGFCSVFCVSCHSDYSINGSLHTHTHRLSVYLRDLLPFK